MCMAGTAMVFACALLSIQAENSTSSDKVETEILKGKNVICIAWAIFIHWRRPLSQIIFQTFWLYHDEWELSQAMNPVAIVHWEWPGYKDPQVIIILHD